MSLLHITLGVQQGHDARTKPNTHTHMSKKAVKKVATPVAIKPNKNLSHLEPLLLEVFKIQNPSDNEITKIQTIEKIMSLIPSKMFVEEDREGNLLFDNRDKKKRTKPVPTIVSHLDQVHEYERGYHFALIGDDKLVAYNKWDQRCGTGGDDKCGIYVAIKMLLSDIPCRAIFVQDEEIGCIGSGEVNFEWGKLSSILLQADRRGNNDLIMHTNGVRIASEELVNRVLALPECKDMKPEYGSVTDVGELCPIFEVAGFNISSGYYEAHYHKEYVLLSELNSCLNRVAAIATMVGNEVQDLPPPTYHKPYAYAKASRGWSDDDDFWDAGAPPTPRKTIKEGAHYMCDAGLVVGPMKLMDTGCFRCDDPDVISSISSHMNFEFKYLTYTPSGMCLHSHYLNISPNLL